MIDSKGRSLKIEIANGQFREPTIEEFEKALEIEAKRKVMREELDKLNHEFKVFNQEAEDLNLKVFHDTAGFIYTTRYFLTTDHIESL